MRRMSGGDGMERAGHGGSIHGAGVMSSPWAATRRHDRTTWWGTKLGFVVCLLE